MRTAHPALTVLTCLLCALVLLCALPPVSVAQSGTPVDVKKPPASLDPASDRNAPLEITADGSLEWDKNHKQMIARGNAIAKQGKTSVAAETLVADYRDSPKTKGKKNTGGDIWRLSADDGVRIQSGESEAFGDKAVYDLDRGVATLTGKALKLVSPGQTVTARDSFEYWVPQGKLRALGKAKVLRGEDVLESDTLIAFLDTDKAGDRRLDRVEADGHVIITTPTERAEGDRGVYNATTQIATLTGHVRLTRGQNILEGERAEINLETNVSRLFGSSQTPDGRVRGVFYPGGTRPE